MERLAEVLNPGSGGQFYLLYGPGVLDTFLTQDFTELPLDAALHRFLKSQGFARIVLHRPDKDIYFLDNESLELSRRDGSESTKQTQCRFSGALGRRMLMQPRPAQPRDVAAAGGVHSARLLEHLLHESEPRTAVIFRQIEQTLERSSANPSPNTLKIVITDWLEGQLADNRNLCIMVFSAPEPGKLVESLGDLGIPALVHWIEARHQSALQGGLVRLGLAGEAEVDRAVDYVRLRYHLGKDWVDWSQRKRLVRGIAHAQAVTNLPSKLRSLQRFDAPHVYYAIQGLGSAVSASDERNAMEKLQALTGLMPIKAKIHALTTYMSVQRSRRQAGVTTDSEPLTMNFIFSGNPGTGKTTVARIVGELLRELGLLKRGHLVETSTGGLVAGFEGQTVLKTNAVIDQALDGVLFIDEAQELLNGEFAKQALRAILLRAENDRGRLCIVLAGYTEGLQKVLEEDAGAKRRFPEMNRIEFPDYCADELFQILKSVLSQRGLICTPEMEQDLGRTVSGMHAARVRGFGNAGEMRALAEALDLRQRERVDAAGQPLSQELRPEDLPEKYAEFRDREAVSPSDVLARVDSWVGLAPVKKYVRTLYNSLDLEQEMRKQAIRLKPKSRHLVFMGNPGTGKTMVAESIGEIYRKAGILRRGHTQTALPNDLVAGYQGQTALKTNELINKALDGVLFVDEAYQLAERERGGYGQEALDTILARMEQDRDRLVVILAGYTDAMKKCLASNSGLDSRFNQIIEFPDYSDAELLEILRFMAKEQGYRLTPGAERAAVEYLKRLKEEKADKFGNARAVRNLFEKMTDNLTDRWANARANGEIVDPLELRADDVPGFEGEKAEAVADYRHFNLVDALPPAPEQTASLSVISRAVVYLNIYFVGGRQGCGSGFIVTPQGHMVTAFHVVRGATAIQARVEGQSTFVEAQLLGFDAQADLAVLSLPAGAYPWMPMAAAGRGLEAGDSVAILAYPMGEHLGSTYSFTDGTVSSLRNNEDVKIVQVSAAATRGSSGGAVVSRQDWKVIGVLQGGMPTAPGFNFAINVEEIYRRFGTLEG